MSTWLLALAAAGEKLHTEICKFEKFIENNFQ